jgi:hypothetical protein
MLDRTNATAIAAEVAFHEQVFAELDAVKFHRELAVMAALEHCVAEEVPPPAWAVREATDLLIRSLNGKNPAKRGRTARAISRYKQDYWDLERWDAVEEIRRIKRKVRSELKLLRDLPAASYSRYRRHYEKMRNWLRQGDFECAAMYLAGRDAKASPQAIRNSYRNVKRRAGKGTMPDRYYLFDDRFLRKIGLPGIQDRKEGTKTFPLYDLKL